MFRIQTRGDLIYYLVLCTLVTTMGVLFLVFPPVPLPADPAAYEQRAGALEAITQRHAGHKSAWVRFRMATDPTIYESRAPRILESAQTWVERQTALSFFVPRMPAGSDRRDDPQTVYGLVAGGVQTRTLAADIAYVNAGATRWGVGLALGIGIVGYLAAFFAWRRVRLQHEAMQALGRAPRARRTRAKRRA
ncbi:hypothetical protein [Methyloversatilis sp.]|uniref:hypothetical protein n=1 Tax=Methyloversatilis sp. TaxID=2569862 RepID=UPI003F706738